MTTAICIATGESLTQEDVDYIRGKGRVYVVNDAYRLAPWADILYACDYEWWDYHKPVFAGEKWTINARASKEFNLRYIEQGEKGFSFDDNKLGTGGNSGFQCLNLAYLHGATKIVLLGYDMGGTHFFGKHPAHLNRGSDFSSWIKHMNEAAALIDIPVFNCTRNTALDCFPKVALRDVL